MKKLLLSILIVALLLTACGGPGGEETAAPIQPTEPATSSAAVETPQPSGDSQPGPISTAEPTRPPAAQERTTIRFAINDYEQPMYQDVIEAFEEENPDLHVEVVSVNEVLGLGPIGQTEIPEDANQRLAAAADVAALGISRETVEQGLVRDLTPFIEADPNFQPDDFYANSLEAYRWTGSTWALPTTLNYRLIFFNKDIFDEAGVAYPEAGWTWDDLLIKAQALTERQGDEVTRWGFVPNGAAYRLVESRAGELADYSTEPPTPRYDDDDVVEAVNWYANLYLKDQVMPYFEPEEEQDTLFVSPEEALIDSGQAAMWTDVDIVWWIRSQQGNIGVVPFPADAPGEGLTPVSVSGLAMSAGTNQPEAAWRWLDFVSRQPPGRLAMGIQFLPARRSAAEVGGFWDDLDEELATALRYATDHGYVTRSPVAYDAFDDALHAILQGEKPVEEAMIEAQAQAQAQLQEEAAERAGATPVPTFVVAPSEEEEPASAEATTIIYTPGLGSLNLEPFRDLADEFHEAHPDIIVEVKMADFVTGVTPDLVQMAKAADCFQWYPSLQDPEQREAILNLQPFLDADPAFTTDDFFPHVLKQFTYQGQIHGLPADVTPYILEYNKDLFDAAGQDYPSLDWTTDDFLALAVALTQGEEDNKQYGFVAEAYELNDLVFMLERLGGKLVDDKADPPSFTFDEPDTAEALRWYANLSTEHGVKPIYITDITKLLAATTAYLEREELINSGRAAMWTSTGTTAALFGDRSDMNLGSVPLPTKPGITGSGYAQASGHFISAQTENRHACWQWLTFLTEQPSAAQGLPARRSVAESNEYREQVGADRADAYLASVGNGELPSAFQIFSDEDWLGMGLIWLGQAYGQVIDGEASVEEALATAQQVASDYRACLIAADDFGADSQEQCAKEVDPTLPDFLFGMGGE